MPSTARRQPGILMNVHPILSQATDDSHHQLPWPGSDGQPMESSHLGDSCGAAHGKPPSPGESDGGALSRSALCARGVGLLSNRLHHGGAAYLCFPVRLMRGEIRLGRLAKCERRFLTRLCEIGFARACALRSDLDPCRAQPPVLALSCALRSATRLQASLGPFRGACRRGGSARTMSRRHRLS
jgi:hypothetical protein